MSQTELLYQGLSEVSIYVEPIEDEDGDVTWVVSTTDTEGKMYNPDEFYTRLQAVRFARARAREYRTDGHRVWLNIVD